jgi:thiosulfate/3-mercaptopyruvate sulfurtransferase
MNNQILYSPKEVQELISQDNTVVVDIREEDDYKKSHIPGAVSIPDIFFYLAETTKEGLKEFQEKFQKLFSAAGITRDKKVIIYEDAFDKRYGASCRGYWFLTYLGHPDAGILDGGFSAWKEAGLPVDNKIPNPESSNFELDIHDEIIATRDDVLAALKNPNIKLLDNRDREEWVGKSSSPYGKDFVPRKGRLPGARWIEWYNFMERQEGLPYFKSPEKIRALCAEYGLYPDDDIIIYCFKGARVSNTFVAMKLAGFKHLRNYLGSWNEWSKDDSLPINAEVYPD